VSNYPEFVDRLFQTNIFTQQGTFKMKKIISVVLLACGPTLTAMAHEGHGTPGQGHTVEHHLLEPVHIPAVILAIAIVLLGAFFLARIVSRRR